MTDSFHVWIGSGSPGLLGGEVETAMLGDLSPDVGAWRQARHERSRRRTKRQCGQLEWTSRTTTGAAPAQQLSDSFFPVPEKLHPEIAKDSAGPIVWPDCVRTRLVLVYAVAMMDYLCCSD